MNKQLLLLGFIIFGFWATTSAQTFPVANPQLYVVKADGQTLLTDSNGISVKDADSNSSFLVYVNPNWIESIEVIKGKEATDKYGTRGQNGVIIMNLNKEGFAKMRPQDKEKFKKE